MRRLLLPISLIAFATSGCVLKATHDETLAANVRLSDTLQKVTKERDDLKNRVTEVGKKNSDLLSRNEEIARTNELIAGKNTDISRRSLETQKELLKLKEEKLDREKRAADIKKIQDDLARVLKAEIAEGNVSLIQVDDQLTIRISDQEIFAVNTDQIQSEGELLLGKVVSVLKPLPQSIMIEGHTDNVQIAKSMKAKFPTNWELSTSRAVKILRFFEEQSISPRRLSAAGYGENHPLADNKSPEGRQKNRRIEILLLSLDKNS